MIYLYINYQWEMIEWNFYISELGNLIFTTLEYFQKQGATINLDFLVLENHTHVLNHALYEYFSHDSPK